MEEDAESARRGPGRRKPHDRPTKSSLQTRKSAQQENLHKQAKQPQPTKDPSPNYMKPTMNAKARKETKKAALSKDSGGSAHKPHSHETKQKPPKSKDSRTPISSRSLAKASRRNPRPSRRVILGVGDVPCHENGHTCGHACSSSLKDVAFPQKLEATHDRNATRKVCSYPCCSLNAHENLPTVKHPLLRRKVSIKAQRSIRVRGVLSSFSRRRGVRRVKKSAGTTTLDAESSSTVSASRKRGVWKFQKKPTTCKHDLQTTNRGASAFNNVKNGGFLDTDPDTSTVEEQLDYESEFSDSEREVIRDFLETIESDDESTTPTGSKVDETKKNTLDELDAKSETFQEEEKWIVLIPVVEIPEISRRRTIEKLGIQENGRSMVPKGMDEHTSDETVEVGALRSDDGEVTTMFENRGQSCNHVEAKREAARDENKRLHETLNGAATSDRDYELSGTNPSPELEPPEVPMVEGDGNDEMENAGGQPVADATVLGFGTDLGDSVEDGNESDMRAQEIINEAEKYLGMELESVEEEECFPRLECQTEDEDLNNDMNLFFEHYIPSSVMEDSTPSPKTNRKLETRLSVKKNLIRKCFEKLRTIRKLTGETCFETAEETNRRKFELRRLMTMDQKDGEEWKIDYKLRLLVDQLAKAQKKKVELLVEAYESVLPKAIKSCK